MGFPTGSPIVTVLSLGGTIAMAGDDAGVVPTITGEELVAAVPRLETVARIEAKSFLQIPGASLRLDDLYGLADEIERCLDQGSSGVVITQGTDTIEETAYALDLLLDREAPVVVTGAMRNPTLPGADGPANLHAATIVAASGLDFRGVVVVLGDEVHSSRRVMKAHATVPAAFVSPGSGPIALVAEDRVFRHCVPAERSRPIARIVAHPTPSVPIVTIGLDDDGRGLSTAAGADAVVLEAPGVGHIPEWLVEPVEHIARQVPVVMTSRTRNGPVLRATYGFPGSESDLRDRGVVAAGSLDTLKVRVLLMLLLRSGAGREEIEDKLKELDEGTYVGT